VNLFREEQLIKLAVLSIGLSNSHRRLPSRSYSKRTGFRLQHLRVFDCVLPRQDSEILKKRFEAELAAVGFLADIGVANLS